MSAQIASTSYARPSPRQHWHVLTGDQAMTMMQDFDTMNYDAALIYHDAALPEDTSVQDSVDEKLHVSNSDQIPDGSVFE